MLIKQNHDKNITTIKNQGWSLKKGDNDYDDDDNNYNAGDGVVVSWSDPVFVFVFEFVFVFVFSFDDDGAMMMVWLFPEAAVSWSGPISPTLLANFSGGEIKDRVSLLNIMISLDTNKWKQTFTNKQVQQTNKLTQKSNIEKNTQI